MYEKNIKEDKALLRRIIKDKIQLYTREELDILSLDISQNLYTLEAWKNAEIILAFLPMKNEVNTLPIIEKALQEGKKAAVPRIDRDKLYFHYIIPDIFRSGMKGYRLHSMGMLEPDNAAPAVSQSDSAGDKTLLITPGLAFDLSCMRLGRGKSFYDRFLSLSGRKNTAAGIAFHFQVVDTVPCEEHDAAVDYVVTDRNIFKR